MKTQWNLTDSRCDLDRFGSRRELLELMEGFDGIELMHYEEDDRELLAPEMVIGYHMSLPEYWLDFWRGDLNRVEQEFDTLDRAYGYYGGRTPDALVQAVKREYENALHYQAEYMVFHVSDAGAWEEMTGQYHHTDREVIDGACELLNAALPERVAPDRGFLQSGPGIAPEQSGSGAGPLLLLENLWQPGLTMTDPEMTLRLLDGIRYPAKGIMLDTGHLMHTNLSLRTQKEALAYIHRMLEEHADLCRYIRGVHLNQSLTGSVMRRYQKNPPEQGADYEERMNQLFTYIFQVDLHRPFVCTGVGALIHRINPDYVTFEFISRNLNEHRQMLRRQQNALKSPGI